MLSFASVANPTPVEMQLSPLFTSYQLLQPDAAPGKGEEGVSDSPVVTGVASTGAAASGTAEGTTVDEATGADDETGAVVAVGVVGSTASEGLSEETYGALPVKDPMVASLQVDPPSTHPETRRLAMSET